MKMKEKKLINKKREITTNVQEPTKEHIVVQLPIPQDRIQYILQENTELLNPLEYSPNIIDPEPFCPSNNFISQNDTVAHSVSKKTEQKIGTENDTNYNENNNCGGIQENKESNSIKYTNCCYWCCHQVGAKDFGLPIKYNTVYDSFTTFGCFCSLECVAAYNYSVNTGSDRMWEIHSWIQYMANKLGYTSPIRPAPSRYLLKMFNGPMEIQEFRDAHKNYLKTYIMNMPPFIHIQGQLEVINTSYLNQKKSVITTTNTQPNEAKLQRTTATLDTKNTLDTKMNLTIKRV